MHKKKRGVKGVNQNLINIQHRELYYSQYLIIIYNGKESEKE